MLKAYLPNDSACVNYQESRLLGEFPHPDLEASVLDVDCTGRYAILAGKRGLSVIDLESPNERAFFQELCGSEPSILKCHPIDGSLFALIRKNIGEVYSWSATEGRVTLVSGLDGFIRPINAVDWCPIQPHILATASSEQFRSISLWDLRTPERLVKNIEIFTSLNMLCWEPFREHNFATAGDFTVQFWDIRASIPERHLPMQTSPVLSLAWSPLRRGEFALSSRDGNLRVWHLEDFDNALLVGNYKKVPMFNLRYTPKGTGIVSLPQRNRWGSSGLILWRSDTLSPMRLVPTADQAGIEITEDSCVLAFGWCRSEFPPANGSSTTFELDQSKTLRDLTQIANLVSWSRDRQLKIHNLPAAFLHADGVKVPSHRAATTSTTVRANSPSSPDREPPSSKRSPFSSNHEDASSGSTPSTQQTDSPAVQFVTQEISLLSFSTGQYRTEEVDKRGVECIVRMRLYYCRRNHYHCRTSCGFEEGVDAVEERYRSDSIPAADLDALFQSTTSGSSTLRSSVDAGAGKVVGQAASLPSAGHVTLQAVFPATYPAPYSQPVFTFIGSTPTVPALTLAKILKDIQRTAAKNVSASRGCLEPCIRKVFQHLNSSTPSVSSDDESDRNSGGEPSLSSSDLIPSSAQDPSEALKTSSTTLAGSSVAHPPPQDAFVPFPRTSGVSISPCGLIVTFGVHQPFIEIVQEAIKSLGSAQSTLARTPRSYHSYRKLVEGKGHFFRHELDAGNLPAVSQGSTRVSQCRVLKKSLSAEAVYDEITSANSGGDKKAGNTGEDMESNQRPKTPVRRRHFSGKIPECEPRKASNSIAASRKLTFTGMEGERTTPNSARRASCAVRYSPFHPLGSNRKASPDQSLSSGSPRAVISDLSPLIPMSKYLAINYSLEIADPELMCSRNLKVARSTSRADLVQFWSFVTSLAGAKLRQPPFPALVPPYANLSIGRAFFRTWLAHFLHIGDVQSLTMLGFVMASIDAQSSPPALLLTAPPSLLQSSAWRLSAVASTRASVNHLWPSDLLQKGQSYRRGGQKQSYARKAKSTVIPPNLALLEIPKMPNKPESRAQPTTISMRSTLKRTRAANSLHQMHQQAALATRDPDSLSPSTDTESTASRRTRTRSNSCSVHTSSSDDPSTLQPTTGVGSLEGEKGKLLATPASAHKDSTATVVSSVVNRSYSCDENANVACLLQQLSEQLLMDPAGDAVEESTQGQDTSYTADVCLFSHKHMLQYTHFLKAYISLLSSWGLIMPRASFSAQWFKVLTWLHMRAHPDFYYSPSSLTDLPTDRHNTRLLSPAEWRPGQPPPGLGQLPVLPAVQTQVVCPSGLSGFAAYRSTENGFGQRTDRGEMEPALLRCAVCNITARGVIVACPTCGHGGHLEHMSAWCVQRGGGSSEITCPVPECECRCSYLRLDTRATNSTAIKAVY